ncbi:MAG TPA: anthranilate synthase component I [Gammaproteobacteria bacterium]|jgi:anthranilate synthase component 1|nr:anthranilate synthase component I [Gammaproteobacteria bacterium]
MPHKIRTNKTDFSSVQPPRTKEEFDSLAAQLRADGFTHCPVVQETLADLDTPVSTYLKLADKPFSYLFESVQGGETWGRYSIIGLPCKTIHRYLGDEHSVLTDGELTQQQTVDNALEHIRSIQAEYVVPDLAGLPEMTGGLVGYFGYETVGYIEPKLKFADKPDAIGAPDILLMVSLDVIVFDNLSGRIFMVTLADLSDPSAYSIARERLNQNVADLAASFTAPRVPQQTDKITEKDYDLHFDQGDFMQAVETCRDYIHAGDIMQVVLSQRLSAPFSGRSIDLYRALRTINPSPYMYYLNLGEFDIVGSSPEILVRLQDGKVTVRPIAGTRKRGATEEQDIAMEMELMGDEKELAEHLMLIDLGRNDVGRIAEIGSVKLTEKMQVERYSHVMHIVSNVDATIKPELDAIDVLKATFPAGTVSGAPKIRAMEIIHELEPIKRGIYSGAVGYIGWNGVMDTAIAIRTAVLKDGTINVQAGAGIVGDSVPKYEWKETLNKARAMIKAVEMANAGLGLAAPDSGEA